jgi:hypothetical protein
MHDLLGQQVAPGSHGHTTQRPTHPTFSMTRCARTHVFVRRAVVAAADKAGPRRKHTRTSTRTHESTMARAQTGSAGVHAAHPTRDFRTPGTR